jgi:hypothetical protein
VFVAFRYDPTGVNRSDETLSINSVTFSGSIVVDSISEIVVKVADSASEVLFVRFPKVFKSSSS